MLHVPYMFLKDRWAEGSCKQVLLFTSVMCCIIIRVEDLYNFCGHRRCCWKFLYTIHVLHVYIFTSIWIHHSCNMYHEIPVLFYVSHIYTSIFFFLLIMYTLLLIFLGKCFIFIHWLFIVILLICSLSQNPQGAFC